MKDRASPAAGWLADVVGAVLDVVALPILLAAAVAGRFLTRPYHVGLGPEPFNSHLSHRDALERRGFRARTYVDHVYYIRSDFDVVLRWPGPFRYLAKHALFAWSVTRCQALFLTFSGGGLGTTRLLWRVEPILLRLADVRTVMLPYGGDIQDMSRTSNLPFKDAMSSDYPQRRLLRRAIENRVDLWTRWADHVVGGCEWVDFLYHWDSLMLLHFPVDTEHWAPLAREGASGAPAQDRPLRVLHAPNHPAIKGTRHIEKAAERLNAAGIPVELRVLQGVSNEEVRQAIAETDVVADQLVMGWYAMFALEAMSMAKPVLCAVRDDLEALYRHAGLLEPDELPLLRCDVETVEAVLRDLATDRSRLAEAGKRSREFVLRRHSLEVIGEKTAAILEGLGITPGSIC